MLHTFAHLLIRELALECGYNAASIRERIYSDNELTDPMAGVLLYTAAADSDGTLGGLVELGKPENLGPLIVRALQRTLAETGGGAAPGLEGAVEKPQPTRRGGGGVRVAALSAAGLALLGAGFAGGRLAAPQPMASGVVLANVPGARVSLNRAPVDGSSPLLLPPLTPGSPYLVEVSAEGYKPFTHTFQARAGSTEIIEARLEPKAK